MSELSECVIPHGQNPLVCIELPCVVGNEERALTCLGGVSSITKAAKQECRLELRFRPEDSLCKPVFAKPEKVTNLVFKIRKRRIKQSSDMNQPTAQPLFEYDVHVLGIVDTQFEFTGLADFQVLPPDLTSAMIPSCFQISKPLDEAAVRSLGCVSFLPPCTLSRFDKPMNYSFRLDPRLEAAGIEKAGELSVAARWRRTGFAYGIPFDYKGSVPDKPHPDVQDTSNPKLKLMRKLFEERPIWSRPSIQAKLKVTHSLAKSLLPLVSYHFTSGPWKTLWVKLGYDPRIHPEAKQYQCLDYRVPKEVDIVEALNHWRLGLRRHKPSKDSTKVVQSTAGSEEGEEIDVVDETTYSFTPDVLPSQRQVFYQLCDIHDHKLQEIIHSSDGKEGKCDEIYGWSDKSTYDRLRRSLNEMTKKTADKIKNEAVAGDRQL